MLKHIRGVHIIDFVVFLLTAFILSYLYYFQIQTDVRNQIIIFYKSLELGIFPIPPLYYLTLYVLGGFFRNFHLTVTVAIFVLSLCNVFKLKVAVHILSSMLSSIYKNILPYLGFGLILSFSILSGRNFYRGELTSNIWHNPTMIFLMPFALLLFYTAIKIIEKDRYRNLIFPFFLLIFINALIKPSYLFVFCFLPLFYWLNYGWNKKTLLFALGSIFAGLVVFAEFQYLFLSEIDPIAVRGVQEKNNIEIAPFAVWGANSANIPISILSSILFPLSVIILFPKTLKNSFYLKFAWIQLLIALIIYSVFAETGYRRLHSNLGWQIIPSMFILFMMSMIEFLKVFKNKINLRLWNTYSC